MSAHLLYKQFLQTFKTYNVFDRDKISRFFKSMDPDISEGAVTWRIHDLKKRKLIRDVKRGVYALDGLPTFVPTISEELASFNAIALQFCDPHFYNIWETRWLNNFVELQAFSSMVIVEVEKGLMESVFFAFRDRGFKEVFLKPDHQLMQHYVSESSRPVIIKPFISRSPVQMVDNIKVPTLEKILVDLHCDDQLYVAFQGKQLERIYEHALHSYALNISTLFTYARRRNQEPAIRNLLIHLSDEEQKHMFA